MVEQIPRQILDKISQQISEKTYPGASLAIYDKGKWLERYLGYQDEKQPVVAGLTYDLASVTKVIGTGTLALQALQEGRFGLDQPLHALYPKWQDSTVTIRQLLTHTSGIDPFIPNRDQLDATELKQAIETLTVTEDKHFRYTDVNFLLLGFLLEEIYQEPLDRLFDQRVFAPWQMTETGYGPVAEAVVTQAGSRAGIVHDPKAKVLGKHTASAGLFSGLKDLENYCQHLLTEDWTKPLWQNYSQDSKERSLAWDLAGDWILHTGYTGTFVMANRHSQQAVIFLSNRTYWKDERAQWIKDRDSLIHLIWHNLKKTS
ncbi:serine hydrolase domain-containing protein [Streptococcus sp. DD12]|uniref:serine hydrolase domain-containing protein n=1 Tax=Streptococcus sp. DD12 TaxID=1777880 RepID=UPI0007946F97|nr:serine hydrolase domain-containing protein [Streptococcus sp. DD12]KXT75696.1 Beta-lactamase, class C [Streptococcus sp. DD12]